ncbi:hypothetical protein SynA1562_01180 [Synechococcus sp. A15-62]|nr:hypothetical protein SynA1562_01180 [Synechococcus sp. A15-62]
MSTQQDKRDGSMNHEPLIDGLLIQKGVSPRKNSLFFLLN